jgi:membrane-associated phospholipid phosphatase
MGSDRLASLTAFLRARFSPEGYLGLHLTVGALLLVVAGWLFGIIAEDVASADTITVLDLNVAHWFHAHANPALTEFTLFITDIHGVLGITVLSVLTELVFIWKREWYWLLALAVSVAGGMLINVLVKYAFHRARPSFDDPLLTLTTYSFPSGHTAGSMLFYGVLTAYLVCHIRSWRWRIPVVVIAVLIVIAVGTSRIYLGAHYLSDVLAAVAESIAWLALSLTTVSTLRRRKEARSLNE